MKNIKLFLSLLILSITLISCENKPGNISESTDTHDSTDEDKSPYNGNLADTDKSTHNGNLTDTIDPTDTYNTTDKTAPANQDALNDIDSNNTSNPSNFKLTNAVINLINTKRQAANLSPLETSENLSSAANVRAKEISIVFSSDRPNSSKWITIAEDHNVKYTSAAEFIASGYLTPEGFVDGILRDGKESSSLLSTEYNKVGVGFYKNSGTNYWELLFINDEVFQPINEESYAKEVLRLVNSERAKYELNEFGTSNLLASAAYKRSEELEGLYAHSRPDGSEIYTVFNDYGITYNTAGENIAYGQRTPEEVVTGWMNSEGHRANILNSNFNNMGVGLHHDPDDGIIYWTQLFTN